MPDPNQPAPEPAFQPGDYKPASDLKGGVQVLTRQQLSGQDQEGTPTPQPVTPPPPPAPVQAQLIKGPAMLKAFKQGFGEQWSAPAGPMEVDMKHWGILPDGIHDETPGQAINATAVGAVETAGRAFSGLYQGIHDAAIAGGFPTAAIGAGMEAFPLAGAEMGKPWDMGDLGQHPLAMSKDGDLVRITSDDQGKPVPTVVGPHPEQADFDMAASAIGRTNPQEIIMSVGVKVDGKVYTAPNHFLAIQKAAQATNTDLMDVLRKGEEGKLIDGFITSKGRFVEREEADKIASAASQKQALKPGQQKAEGGLGANELNLNTLPPQKLQDGWQTYGIHPYEYAAAAERSPVMARDLSSASTPPLPIPARPSRQYLNEIDDRLFKLRGAYTADQAELLDILDKMPSDIKDPALQDKWYKFAEGDQHGVLTPQEGKDYNTYMVPLLKQQLELYERAAKTDIDVSDYDPNYIHRMVIGKTPEVDKLAGQAGAQANPIYNGPGLLSRSTSSMHERRFYALENPMTGERKIVGMNEQRDTLRVPGGTQALFKAERGNQIAVGDKITLNGQEYTLRNAITSEIEANTKVRYYKNALINTLDNILHLRAVNRAISAIQQMRDSPEWAAYTASAHGPAPENWKSPQMPLFKNDKMDPKLADVIDDFYGKPPLDKVETALEAINHYAVGSMFWTPFPHAFNAGSWWFTERGWDNITPQGFGRLMFTGAQAIKEVVTQGPKYREILRNGGSLMYGGIANRDFYKAMLTRAGMELPKSPEWKEVAETVGLAPGELVKSIYNAASTTLWAASDMFAVQRILELERKGSSMEQAIHEAEQVMPNYRVRSTLMGSRTLQQIYTSPVLFQFSRYHYGVLKGFANIAKSLAVGNLQQKNKAIGQIMAMGTLSMLIWPALSYALQKVTGDKDVQLPDAGPGRLIKPVIGSYVQAHPSEFPQFIKNYYKNDGDLMQALSDLAPLSPILKGSLEASPQLNRYMYSGRSVAEPSDVRNNRWGRVAAQETEHAAETMVEPYNIFHESWKTGEPIPQVIMEDLLGLSDASLEKTEARERAFHYQDREAIGRQRKPVGPIEELAK